MLEIKEDRGEMSLKFEGTRYELVADVCSVLSSMLEEAKKCIPLKNYMCMLRELTLFIEKEVQDIENQGGAFSFFSQSE